MAQQVTGLGWSAKSEWLKHGSGLIAGIQQVRFSENLPHGNYSPDIGTIIAGGCSFYMDGVKWYVFLQGVVSEGDLGVCVNVANSSYATRADVSFILLSKTNGTTVSSPYTVHITNGSDRYSSTAYSTIRTTAYFAPDIYGITDGIIQVPFNVYSAETDVIYTRYGGFNWNEIVAGFAQEMLPPPDYVYKDNDGWAVAAICEWYSATGTHFKTPILISSVSEYTDMSCANTQYNLAKLNFLYDGVRFYMSFYDTVDVGITSDLPLADLTPYGAAALSKVFSLIADESFSNIIVITSPDPYQEGDGSEEGGADGEEEDEEDDVDFTDPPSTSIGATGFLTIFCPSLAELRSLATFMWGSFDVDNWRKLFANPMDAILGLHIIPVPAVISGTKAVKVGGIDTTIDMSYTTIRYIRRPMGTCEIPKKWGAYLDYNPYTKLSVFLPYIGFKEIDADDVMGKTIALQYIIDILTGACVAELKCGDTVLYSWQGNCANEVPISGSDWRGAITSALGIAATVATTVATGGASAPMIAGTIASVGANSLNLKPTINRSGSISGSAGFIGNQRPYIIRTIPNLVIPADQNKYIGYPSFVTMSLGSLTGYNEIASVHLEGISATGAELDELEAILKGGVIF